MEKIKKYVQKEFSKLPHKRYYKNLKSDILNDCADKLDDYKALYGKEAEDKIIEEIGTHHELYQGGFTRIDYLSLLSIIILPLFIIICLILKNEVIDIIGHTYRYSDTIYGIPYAVILYIPRLFGGMAIAYSLTFILLWITKRKLVAHTKYSKIMMILGFFILWLIIIILLIQIFMNLESNIMILLLTNQNIVIYSVVYGILLGLVSYQFILLVKE